MTTETKIIMEKLDSIQSELNYIQNHMFDPDAIMTTEESRRFEQSMKELNEGKTTPLSKLKKEFGL